jgi:hypothetical protein
MRVPTWKPASPAALAYYRHLYTSAASGTASDEIERWLERDFETPAQEPIRRALAGQQLSRGDWRALIRYVAAQDVRTPSRMIQFLARMQAQMPAMLQSVLDNLEQSLRSGKAPAPAPAARGPGIPLRIETELGHPKPDLATIKATTFIGRTLWLAEFDHLLNRTAQVLQGHRWTMLRAPAGVDFLTSDCPVARLYGSSLDGGWGTPGAEIMMPLSPRCLIFTRVGDRHPPPRGSTIARELAQDINRLITTNAHRLIIARRETPEVEQWRPRVVDRERFEAERAQWEHWHQAQSEAELNLLS